MKIKSIKLERFRPFKNLRIKELPKEARLVVMVGPNGSGKSSIFDALLRLKHVSGRIYPSDPDSYLIKFDSSEKDFKEPEVKFHKNPDTQEAWRKSVHVRSAYRNDSVEVGVSLQRANSLIQELRFRRLAENDRVVVSNYNRLLNLWVERMSSRTASGETADEIDNDLYGELRDVIGKLLKCHRLFRPKISKVKIRFFVEIL